MTVSGCVDGQEQPVDQIELAGDSQFLYVQHGVMRWDPGDRIPVCWVTAGLDAEKAIILQALQDTWEDHGSLDLVGFDVCPTTGSAQFVRVLVERGSSAWGGGNSRQGRAALMSPAEDASARSTRIALPQNGHIGRIQYLAVHEFGHVLGFGHEQDRPDNTSVFDPVCNPEEDIVGAHLSGYDPASVMHYCNSGNNLSGLLSDGDKAGIALAYGPQATCGNRVVEPSEACDDGNTRSFDACASDCERSCPANRIWCDCIGPGRCETAALCDRDCSL